jgi:hypothetical protein
LTQAIISKEIGFQGMFFQRMDYREKEERKQNGSTIFNWKLTSGQNLTAVIIDDYTTPQPLNFDGLWGRGVLPEVISYFKKDTFI